MEITLFLTSLHNGSPGIKYKRNFEDQSLFLQLYPIQMPMRLIYYSGQHNTDRAPYRNCTYVLTFPDFSELEKLLSYKTGTTYEVIILHNKTFLYAAQTHRAF